MTGVSWVRTQYHFWPSDGGDAFDAWNVDRLIELAEGLPVELVDVDSIDEVDTVYWFDSVEQPTVRNVIEHARRITDVDMRYPIILGPDGRVLDGMHRIARAILEGRAVLDALRFAELPRPDHRNVRPDELRFDQAEREQ